jgi:hypothetical protein
MYARWLLALGITTSLQAQQVPQDLLQQVRAKVGDTLDPLPLGLSEHAVNLKCGEKLPHSKGHRPHASPFVSCQAKVPVGLRA